jgi:large subunit ribosomal protein L13
MDSGDFVIVINADKVKLTGKKLQQKVYYSHSNYPGGLKTIKAETLLKQKPDKMFRLAVRGMLPKNTLGRAQLGKLKIYAADSHPHQAQQPQTYNF